MNKFQKKKPKIYKKILFNKKKKKKSIAHMLPDCPISLPKKLPRSAFQPNYFWAVNFAFGAHNSKRCAPLSPAHANAAFNTRIRQKKLPGDRTQLQVRPAGISPVSTTAEHRHATRTAFLPPFQLLRLL